VAPSAAGVVAPGRRRQGIEAGGRIAALFYDEQVSLDDAQDRAEQALYAATRAGDDAEHGFVSLATAVQERSAAYTAILEGEADIPGVLTGLDELDKLLGGFKPGQLVTIGARPSIGKSALMQSIARHIARGGGHVGIFSLEMSRDEIVDRFCAQETGIPLDVIANYRVSGSRETGLLWDAYGTTSKWPVSIDDQGGLSITTIRARARRLHRARPLACLFVDYLQLIAWGAREDEYSGLTTISKGLKALAKELGIPVVALAQLNREVEKRANPTPILADFRGSGSIEQDSDAVIFPVRPALHQSDADPRLVELHIAKQRNGPVGVARCHFDGPRTLHINLPSAYRAAEGYDYAA
jgi:replicative DNA helicase